MTIRLAAALLGCLIALLAPAPLAALTPPAATTGAATAWLRAQQNPDGGFGAPQSTPSLTTDAVLAFAAAGVDIASVRRDERTPIDYLAASVPTYGAAPGGAGKLALTVMAVGLDPRAFGGRDLIATILAGRAENGQFGQSLFEHGQAVLALAAAGESVPSEAVARIVTSQISDGSWAFAGPGQPGEGDTNTTALMLQALVASGRIETPTIVRALDYFRQSQAPGGGFVYAPGQETPPIADVNSTAFVAQALLALDEAPNAPAWGRALDYLTRLQNPSGAFGYRADQPAANLYATVQAVPAMTQLFFPFLPGDATGTRARRLAARPLPEFASSDERRYVPETGHTIAYGFKQYWEANGDWRVFGLPITEEFRELNPADGQVYTVQYFERARFEYHPEHAGTRYETQLGLLGRQATAGRSDPAFEAIAAAPEAGCAYFAATEQAVCGPALAAWQTFGGVDTFGYPVSQPYQEGDTVVQWFERARFEYDANMMRFGLLGREALYRPFGPVSR